MEPLRLLDNTADAWRNMYRLYFTLSFSAQVVYPEVATWGLPAAEEVEYGECFICAILATETWSFTSSIRDSERLDSCVQGKKTTVRLSTATWTSRTTSHGKQIALFAKSPLSPTMEGRQRLAIYGNLLHTKNIPRP